MWEKVGLERDEAGLREALATLEGWEARLSATKPESLAGLELRNLVTVGRLATHAALTRRESRGAHFRLDYPQPSPEWERHLALVSLPA
jgi:L-aspartate oxidase